MSIKRHARLRKIRGTAGLLAAVLFVSLLAPRAAMAETIEDGSLLVSEEELANEAFADQAVSDNEAFMADGWDDSLYSNTEDDADVPLAADGEDAEDKDAPGEAGTALYFIPHQDDEILTFSCSIIKDLQGRRDVQVVLCTDGRNSRAFAEINEERKKSKKKALTVSEFVAARDKEFRGSLTALGVKAENIHIPEDRLADGTTAKNMGKLNQIIQRYIEAYPGADVRVNMPVAGEISAHTDHADIGIAVVDMYKSGLIGGELLLFMDSYKYAKYIEAGLPELQTVPANYEEEWTVIERIRLNSAVRAYHYGSEYGIGYRSSGGLFSAFLKDPHSYYYRYQPGDIVRFGGSQRYETARFAANGTTLEGISEANFMAPTEEILIEGSSVIAPNGGSGVDPASKGSKTNPGGTLVLAYGGNFPDALAATSLGAEIMLTKTNELVPEARAEILRTLPGRIVIMGSAGVVSDKVVKAINSLGKTVTKNELKKYYGAEEAETLVYHPEIIRCGGNNRYETAEALVKKFGYHSATASVIVTTGANYADAVSIAPYAAKTNTPILLATSKGELTDKSYKLLQSFGEQCSNAIIIGGPGVVSGKCAGKLEQIGLIVTRLAGTDRFETSAAVAQFSLDSGVGLGVSRVSLAVGSNFPDALIAGPITANNDSVLILCHKNAEKWSSGLKLLAAHKEEIIASGRSYCVFGGPNVVTRGTIEMALCAVN